MKQKIADIGVTVAVALGILLCVSFGCSHVTQEKQPVAMKLADGSSTNIPQRELRPAFTETVETVGGLFGPAGEAIAKCGLAVAALILAEQNRRKLNRHLKEGK